MCLKAIPSTHSGQSKFVSPFSISEDDDADIADAPACKASRTSAGPREASSVSGHAIVAHALVAPAPSQLEAGSGAEATGASTFTILTSGPPLSAAMMGVCGKILGPPLSSPTKGVGGKTSGPPTEE